MPRPRAHAPNKQGGKPAGQDTSGYKINEDNFTFFTFKTDDSIKWKLMYSMISFWGEILLFK